MTLRNEFKVLTDVNEDDEGVDRMWQHCKSIFAVTCKEVLGYRQKTRKEWIGEDTWKGIKTRREAKQTLNRETCMEKRLTEGLQEQMKRWIEHFQGVLNRPIPKTDPELNENDEELSINCGRISKNKLRIQLRSLKMGRHQEEIFLQRFWKLIRVPQ